MVLALFAALGDACALADRPTLPPEGQIVLYVTTDAVLPAPPSEPNSAPGLFDRLSIEIFPPGETAPCAGCVRQFSIDSRAVDEGRVSMGYLPRPGVSGSRARVRLFRTRGAEIVGARATSTLETVIALPVVGADGITEVTAVLETASLGAPVGTLDAPSPPRPGKPAPGLVGTWEAARRSACTGPTHSGEVCVGGGAFWLGEPVVALPFPDQKHGLEHLVAVSPFYLDTAEVTVKSFREAGLADGIGPGRVRIDAECNYSELEGTRESYPVNCISRDMAQAYCATKGGRLPTEAEYEYVATAFGRFDRYPWGSEPPRCGDAIFGRAVAVTSTATSSACAPAKGTAAVGTSARDRIAVPGGGEIVDLAGNVSEWTADDYAEESEPCLTPPILLDPRCKMTGAGTKSWSARGANYASELNAVNVKLRYKYEIRADDRPRSTGLRCARTIE